VHLRCNYFDKSW